VSAWVTSANGAVWYCQSRLTTCSKVAQVATAQSEDGTPLVPGIATAPGPGNAVSAWVTAPNGDVWYCRSDQDDCRQLTMQ
jgi:hypothetical protein